MKDEEWAERIKELPPCPMCACSEWVIVKGPYLDTSDEKDPQSVVNVQCRDCDFPQTYAADAS